MRVRSLLSNFYDPEFIEYSSSNGRSLKNLVHRINSTAHLEIMREEHPNINDSSLINRKISHLSQFDNLELSPPSIRFIRDMFYEYGFFPLIVKNITLKRSYSSFEDAFTLSPTLDYDYAIKIREGEIVALAVDYEVKLVESVNYLTELNLLIIPNMDNQPPLTDFSQTKILTSEFEDKELKDHFSNKIMKVRLSV